MKKIIATLLLLTTTPVMAQDAYKIQVTRKGQDLYQVGYGNNQPIIQTRYCYEYAYSEDSVLTWDGSSGKLIFLSSNASCDVVKILR